MGAKFYWDNWVFTGGGGSGAVKAYGIPNARNFGSAAYRYQIDLDSDKDGILYFDDLCPEETEDLDGFEDADGCIDPDDDLDTIPDVSDKCREQPEDFDGFEDEDGCPEDDNDGDGIFDTLDGCVNEPEDKDGFQDEDGCPDLDHDGDKIPYDKDLCPEQPEDFDAFEDEDGCPEDDNDGDGIPDERDQCPLKKETYNENADEDGCPDKRLRKVVLTATEIKIPQKLLFKVNKANLKKKSKKMLKKLAKVLKKNPDVLKVLIEGHTDQTGSAAYNMKLSIQRAEAVKAFLVKRGISAARLEAKGFGDTQIIDERKSEKAAKRNRRVQFKVLKMKSEEIILEDGQAIPEGAVLKEVISAPVDGKPGTKDPSVLKDPPDKKVQKKPKKRGKKPKKKDKKRKKKNRQKSPKPKKAP